MERKFQIKKFKINPDKEKLGKAVDMIKSYFKKAGVYIATLWSKIVALWHSFENSKGYPITKKVIFGIFCLLAFANLLFGVMIYGLKAEDKATRFAAKIIPFPIAVVGVQNVTYSEYLAEKDYIHHFYSSTDQTGIDYKAIDQQIIDQLIENKIVRYEALKYKVKVPKSDVDNAINGIIDQNGGQDKVEKTLSDLYGLKLDQFRDLVETQLLRDKLDQTVIAKVTVRHILITVDKDATQDKVDAAKAKIDDLLSQIRSGADFADIATKNSQDTGSAVNGGLLDPFEKGEMVTEFSDAAFATPVGQISDPVRTEFGWHIIKVEAKTGTVPEKFVDWLASLKDKFLTARFFEA